MNGTRRRVLCDQCLLFGELNLALPNTPPHKPALSASFIKMCDRLDVLHGGCQKEPFWLFGRRETILRGWA